MHTILKFRLRNTVHTVLDMDIIGYCYYCYIHPNFGYFLTIDVHRRNLIDDTQVEDSVVSFGAHVIRGEPIRPFVEGPNVGAQRMLPTQLQKLIRVTVDSLLPISKID